MTNPANHTAKPAASRNSRATTEFTPADFAAAKLEWANRLRSRRDRAEGGAL